MPADRLVRSGIFRASKSSSAPQSRVETEQMDYCIFGNEMSIPFHTPSAMTFGKLPYPWVAS
jgi:hypothetical protein